MIQVQPDTQGSTKPNDGPMPAWRFWVPLILQVFLVLMVPSQAIYAHFAGTPVVLQTIPVDPYSLLQGYYVVLRYDISLPETLEDLPGWNEVKAQADTINFSKDVRVYVVMDPPDISPEDTASHVPLPWTPVRVSTTRPDLESGQVAIEGTYQTNRITYGLEQYFIPEEQRIEINERIRQAQQAGDSPSYVVNVNVTPQGNSVAVSIWVDGITYRF